MHSSVSYSHFFASYKFSLFFLKLKNNKTFHRHNKLQLVKIKYSFFFVMFEVISSLALHCASDTAHNIATSKEADIFTGRQKRVNKGLFTSPNGFNSDSEFVITLTG